MNFVRDFRTVRVYFIIPVTLLTVFPLVDLVRIALSVGGNWMQRRKTKVNKVMSEYKRGVLHSGSKTGPRVRSRAQAVAIALSYAGKSWNKKRK